WWMVMGITPSVLAIVDSGRSGCCGPRCMVRRRPPDGLDPRRGGSRLAGRGELAIHPGGALRTRADPRTISGQGPPNTGGPMSTARMKIATVLGGAMLTLGMFVVPATAAHADGPAGCIMTDSQGQEYVFPVGNEAIDGEYTVVV